MALVTTAGTETLRQTIMADVDNGAWYNLITGEQHHIYTVLSVVIFCETLQSEGNVFMMKVLGYDMKTGSTDVSVNLLEVSILAKETFTWDTKFSFNGFETVNYGTGGITAAPASALDQYDAVAAQGGTATQRLQCSSTHASDAFHVVCTYIDQNNE